MFRCGSLISHNDRMFKHAAGAHHNRRDEEEINRGDSSLELVWPARPHKRLPGAVLSCANAVSSSGLALLACRLKDGLCIIADPF